MFNPETLERLNALLPELHAPWLVVSIGHFAFRAHCDVAAALVAALPTEDDKNPEAQLRRQHLAMGVVEEVFQQVDLFWRVVAGLRAHREGRGFLAGFCSRPAPATTAKIMRAGGVSTWDELLRVEDTHGLRERVRRLGLGSEHVEAWLRAASELPSRCATATGELERLYVKPRANVKDASVEAMSLRDANDIYRHGTRVLYEECVTRPTENVAMNPATREGMSPSKDEVLANPSSAFVQLLDHSPRSKIPWRTTRVPTDDASLKRMVKSVEDIAELIRSLVLWLISTEPPAGAALARTD